MSTSSATFSPIACASWCTEGDGHPLEMFAEDQWCRSMTATVSTGLHAPRRHDRDGDWVRVDGSTVRNNSRTYAAQDAGAPPFVVVVNQNDQAMNLTPSEARELARTLVHMAWVAEQDAQA